MYLSSKAGKHSWLRATPRFVGSHLSPEDVFLHGLISAAAPPAASSNTPVGIWQPASLAAAGSSGAAEGAAATDTAAAEAARPAAEEAARLAAAEAAAAAAMGCGKPPPGDVSCAANGGSCTPTVECSYNEEPAKPAAAMEGTLTPGAVPSTSKTVRLNSSTTQREGDSCPHAATLGVPPAPALNAASAVVASVGAEHHETAGDQAAEAIVLETTTRTSSSSSSEERDHGVSFYYYSYASSGSSSSRWQRSEQLEGTYCELLEVPAAWCASLLQALPADLVALPSLHQPSLLGFSSSSFSSGNWGVEGGLLGGSMCGQPMRQGQEWARGVGRASRSEVAWKEVCVGPSPFPEVEKMLLSAWTEVG